MASRVVNASVVPQQSRRYSWYPTKIGLGNFNLVTVELFFASFLSEVTGVVSHFLSQVVNGSRKFARKSKYACLSDEQRLLEDNFCHGPKSS